MRQILSFTLFVSLSFVGILGLYLLLGAAADYEFYLITTSVILVFTIVRGIEHLAAITHTPQDLDLDLNEASDHKLERLPSEAITVVIPAYLPAEQGIIIDTLSHFLTLDLPLQIMLVYNTPEPLPIEDSLRQLPIQVIKVPDSTSKAENLNYAIPLIETPYTAIFDADHQPIRQNFQRALAALQTDHDIIQGSCLPLIESPLSRFLSVEMNQMYNVNHYTRQCLWGFAIFGGSNAYFKTEVLQKLAFDHRMLTEDIDLTLRAILNRIKIGFDREIISYERTPNTLGELWKQRTRWAQGWLQVSFKYGLSIFSDQSAHLSLQQKLGLAMLFPLREIAQLLILQPIPLAIALSIQAQSWEWRTPGLAFVVVTLGLFLSEPFWVFKVRGQGSVGWFWFCVYALLSPFYLVFLTHTVIHAYFRQIRGQTRFEVTRKDWVGVAPDPLSPRSSTPIPSQEGI